MGGTGPSCSTDTPNPHTWTRYMGTRPLSPCHHSPVLNSSQGRALCRAEEPELCKKQGNRDTGTHCCSCRPIWKLGWEANTIFSPAQSKQSFPFPPGTSNSIASSAGADSVQKALAHSSTTLPLDSPNICIWKQAGKHQHGLRLHRGKCWSLGSREKPNEQWDKHTDKFLWVSGAVQPWRQGAPWRAHNHLLQFRKSHFYRERLLEIKQQQSCLQPNSRLLQLGNDVSKAARGTCKLLHRVWRHKSFSKDLGRVPWGKALNLRRVTSGNIKTFVKYWKLCFHPTA